MKTTFIRAVEASVDGKAAVLLDATRQGGSTRFEVDLAIFERLPRSSFAYWIRPDLLEVFTAIPPFSTSSERVARVGLQTSDDFRFLRCAFEVPPASRGARWFPFAKGAGTSSYYADIGLVVGYSDADQVGLQAIGRYGRGADCYFRPGLTWPKRAARFGPRILPAGCIFAHRGQSCFSAVEDLEYLLGILNSDACDYFFKLSLGRFGHPEFLVGTLNQTPVPEAAGTEIRSLSLEAWRAKRDADSCFEVSHAFLLPGLLRYSTSTLGSSVQSFRDGLARSASRLQDIQASINAIALQLYGVSVPPVVGPEADSLDDGPGAAVDDDEEETSGAETADLVSSLLSWGLGAAFGRFDVRLATGERPVPPEPEPFDPLPVCSPGMLTGDDGLPVAAPPSGYPLTFPADGILVDDPGHPRDVVRAVRSVFETVFGDANARWHEAAELLGTPDLRTWIGRDFFESHIKRYSKSRRKAPIYWQLATASGSYSVWIYIHRATGDTLFRVLNDFVGPKLDHEKAKLDGLTQEAGPNPSAAQRREIEQQETFVGELQALKTEVTRAAPLWKPNLDDGVILSFAPLWRLVPQSRSWQGECKKAWDKLVSGDYDWTHVAMHLWPERVVPKCIDDRSLAIAHGLEEVFWHEDSAGAWRKTQVDDATVQQLIRERTSSTVKAALNDLLFAQAPTASGGRRAATRAPAPRPVAPAPVASAPRSAAREPAADVMVSDATLTAVRGAIGAIADGASKADVLAATGLSDADWNKAIAVLLDRGQVSRTGQKRGARYHAAGESNA
jgi:hypothetical protein